MDLKKYILEAISSGKFSRSSAKEPDNLSFDSVVKWLTDLGVRRLNDKEIRSLRDHEIMNGPVFWAGKSSYYKCPDIDLFLCKDGNNIYNFDMVYHDGEKEPSKIFANREGFTVMVSSTNDEIIDFISQCLL